MESATIDLAADAKPTRKAIAEKALTGYHGKMFRPKFPDDAQLALEKVIKRLRMNSRNRPGEFIPTFVVGARGGGKSQALIELSMQVLDDIEDEDPKRAILPIFVYCGQLKWNRDIDLILEDLEKKIVEAILEYFEALRSAAEKGDGHEWGRERENLKKIANQLPDLESSPEKREEILSRPLRNIAQPLVDDQGISLVVMMEDFDKVGPADAVAFLDLAQNSLSDWPVQMVFTFQTNTYAKAAEHPGCNWAITTGARFSGEEKITLPDLAGQSEFVKDALKSRMMHVHEGEGNNWAFEFESEPDNDLSRFEGIFANIDDLYKDRGIAKIIQVARASDYIDEGAIRNVLRAADIVLNHLSPNSPQYGPIEVSESLVQDTPNHLKKLILEMVNDLDDEQVELLHDLYEWIIEEDNFDVFVEGMHAARNSDRDHKQPTKAKSNAIAAIADEDQKNAAASHFKSLGLIASDHEPKLGLVSNFFRDHCCDKDRAAGSSPLWINDSTPAICNHFRAALRAPIENQYDAVKLKEAEVEAEFAKGPNEWKQFSNRLGGLVKKRQATMGGWGEIPPGERDDIISDWLSNFDKWLLEIALEVSEFSSTYIDGNLRRLMIKINQIYERDEENEKQQAASTKKAKTVYRHFFRTRGLDPVALKVLQQVWSNKTEGKTPLDLKDHLPEIIRASTTPPTPIPMLSLDSPEHHCEVDFRRRERPDSENTGESKVEPYDPKTWVIYPTQIRKTPTRAKKQLIFIGEVLNSIRKPITDVYNDDYDIFGDFKDHRVWTFFEDLEREIFFQFVASGKMQDVFEHDVNSDETDIPAHVKWPVFTVNWRPMPGKFEGSEWDTGILSL